MPGEHAMLPAAPEGALEVSGGNLALGVQASGSSSSSSVSAGTTRHLLISACNEASLTVTAPPPLSLPLCNSSPRRPDLITCDSDLASFNSSNLASACTSPNFASIILEDDGPEDDTGSELESSYDEKNTSSRVGEMGLTEPGLDADAHVATFPAIPKNIVPFSHPLDRFHQLYVPVACGCYATAQTAEPDIRLPDLQNELITSDAFLNCQLGSGAFATVHLVRHVGSKKLYAVKTCEFSAAPLARRVAIAEAVNLCSLSFPRLKGCGYMGHQFILLSVAQKKLGFNVKLGLSTSAPSSPVLSASVKHQSTTSLGVPFGSARVSKAPLPPTFKDKTRAFRVLDFSPLSPAHDAAQSFKGEGSSSLSASEPLISSSARTHNSEALRHGVLKKAHDDGATATQNDQSYRLASRTRRATSKQNGCTLLYVSLPASYDSQQPCAPGFCCFSCCCNASTSGNCKCELREPACKTDEKDCLGCCPCCEGALSSKPLFYEDGKPPECASQNLLITRESAKDSQKHHLQCHGSSLCANIVACHDIFFSDTSLTLVLDYCAGGDLLNFVAKYHKSLTPVDAASIISQIFSGLAFLHDNLIIHRDIKLENVLLVETLNENGQFKLAPRIKITDFGLSVKLKSADQKITSRCGSDEYLAPELVIGTDYEGPPVDVWAGGVVAFAVLVGQLPFWITERDEFVEEKPNAQTAGGTESARASVASLNESANTDPNLLPFPSALNGKPNQETPITGSEDGTDHSGSIFGFSNFSSILAKNSNLKPESDAGTAPPQLQNAAKLRRRRSTRKAGRRGMLVRIANCDYGFPDEIVTASIGSLRPGVDTTASAHLLTGPSKNFIQSILTRSALKRPKASEICQHQWIKDQLRHKEC